MNESMVLTKRSQMTKIDAKLSDQIILPVGVPQRPIPGLLLFTLDVNSLSDITKHLKCVLNRWKSALHDYT